MTKGFRGRHECGAAGSVAEEFTLKADRTLVKHLSISGYHGTSSVSVSQEFDAAPPLHTLKAIWDKTSLTGAISYHPADNAISSIRIADVFCGAGGMSHGVSEAIRSIGFRPIHVLAVDVDPVALEVYRRNFDPEHYSTDNLWASVTSHYSVNMSESEFRFLEDPHLLTDELRACIGNVDILLGSPPCEGHSSSNNATRRSDPRNMYYAVMPALAVALGAKAVIVENVPGIAYDRRSVLSHAKGLFNYAGYLVDERIVNAIEVGLPQTRKRHVLVASTTRRPDIDSVIQALARKQTTLSWAISDLVCIDSDDPMDASGELSVENRRRIDHMFENNEYNLRDHLRPQSHRNGHTYPSIYGRLRWGSPSGTITTGFNTPGRGRYIHPALRRTLTPHEAARIQGFPDSFSFKTIDGRHLTRQQMSNLIGNAVPPSIGYAVGVTALAALDL